MSDTVAAVIIGNEVLSAKVVDLNGPYLIEQMTRRGIRVQSVFTVSDDVDAIVEAVLLAKRNVSAVITSGGIGPTHDDVTVRAVSLALARPIERIPEMEAMLRQAFDGDPPAAALRMAEGPRGARLLQSADARFPVLVCENIYMLPGVPQLFKVQCASVLNELRGTPLVVKTIFLNASESDLAQALDSVALAMPDVAIGSYPTWDEAVDYKVKLTFEHRNETRVREAVTRWKQLIPRDCVIVREASET
jgi:molybdenum cofactor synthesis domain-containing protein